LPLWNQATRIGGGLTPSRVSTIIREADAGEPRRLIDLANECRQRDAHLQAVLSSSEESIAGLKWQIVPPDDARSKDKRAAKWIDTTLRTNPHLHRLIADLAGAVFYGHAASEIIWAKDKGRLVPDRFVQVAPRRFRFRRDDGAFVMYDDGGPEIDIFREYPNKFVCSRPRVTGDVPQREGLKFVLVWMSTMRNWSIGDWLKTGEMSWKPWRIGTYKKTATSHEDRSELADVMRRLTTDFSAVIPDSTEIRIEWPNGATTSKSTHGEIVNVLAQEMSKAVLGQTETTQASASSGYAQAKVHDAVRKDLRESRARQIATDLTRDLIAPMVALNFGASVRLPRFEFITAEEVDAKVFSEAIVNVAGAGVIVPQGWIRDQMGIPEPKGDEPTIGGQPEGETDDGKTDGDGAKKPDTEKPDAEPDDGDDEEPASEEA
ncbi:MAG TPA: DUF935 family protein, partial [Vicinamibacterales bacterium]|nr:DUF935 family protein [Vicinamibacterales bacterium]